MRAPGGSPHRNGDTIAASEAVMEVRKKEMKAELDAQLIQLDSERKEGLYRLDWELAEAVEALHAKHAARANKMIKSHKETVSQMEKRVQAGDTSPMKSPMQARSPAQAPVSRRQLPRAESSYSYVEEESAEEESEAESEEETAFDKINNFLGTIRDEFLPQEPVERRPQMGQQMYPQYYMNGHAPPMNGHGPMEHFQNGHQNGALGSPEMKNGHGSPMSHPFAQGPGFGSPHQEMPQLEVPPELPFANGQGFEAQSPFSNGSLMPGFSVEPMLPPLVPLTSDWSPSAVGLSPELGLAPGLINSFGQLSSSPQPGPMRPTWPPANVYHGGGYASLV